MKFSIITVTFNAEKGLPKTIASVRAQSYKNFELIVIDGMSSDNTLAIIESNKDIITYSVSESDKGIYDAMNKGINISNGDFCMFLNAGDALYNQDVLKDVNNQIKECSNNAIYIGYADYDNGIKVNTRYPNLTKLPYTFCHQAIFFKTSVIKKNKYNITFQLSGDSELLYRLIQNGYNYTLINVKVALEEAGVGATESNLLKSTKELYSIQYLKENVSALYRLYHLTKIYVYLLLTKLTK